jgi:hypothetical protein
MSYSILIQVTQEDINAGEAGNCYSCPLALAIRRVCPGSLPWVQSLGVGWRTSHKHGPVDSSPLPREATAFIDRFDVKRDVSPFSFVLALKPSTVDHVAHNAGLIS